MGKSLRPGRKKAPNGYYDPSDGSIHIDLNAGQSGNLKSYRDNLVKAALTRIGKEFGVFTDYQISDVNVEIRLSIGFHKLNIKMVFVVNKYAICRDYVMT